MAQLRYIGYVDKTLIDVAPLSHGVVISVDDDFAARLLSTFPNEYEAIDVPAAAIEDNAPAPTTKKAATATTTDATTSAAAPAATNE